MKLVKFSVTNYRSIIKASSFPVSNYAVLIGPNNEGKSNILRALVIALNAIELLNGRMLSEKDANKIIYKFGESFLDRNLKYNWERDFPMLLQEKTRIKKSTILISTFELTEAEQHEFWVATSIKLSGVLPICIEIDNEHKITFSIKKRGRFHKTISSKKVSKIADFISNKINICYIDAIRTSETAQSSIADLIGKELIKLQNVPEYKDALDKINDLQKPILDNISRRLNTSLKYFIPNISATEILFEQERMRRFFRRDLLIKIDDGTKTELRQKGHGIQSLTALAMARYVATKATDSDSFILAIEEPESHLHPEAIQQIKKVLEEISEKSQLIITTHSPLLVRKGKASDNIIVCDNKAIPAESIHKIRDILGVRAADNLMHADLILLVEGETDQIALSSLFREYSVTLKSALDKESLAILSAKGVGKMGYLVKLLTASLCKFHICVDNDSAAREEIRNALTDNLIAHNEYTMLKIRGKQHSEIEDLYDEEIYLPEICSQFGVAIDKVEFRNGNGKWSDKLKRFFMDQGKIWDEDIEAQVKYIVADAVKNSASSALLNFRRNTFDSLLVNVEKLL
jgi:predicted ATPase